MTSKRPQDWTVEKKLRAVLEEESIQGVELGAYLDEGGKLFLSGQDIGWDMCDTESDFDREYLWSGGAS